MDSNHGKKLKDKRPDRPNKLLAVSNRSRQTHREQQIPKARIIQSTYKLYNATWYKDTKSGDFGARLLERLNKSKSRQR